MRKAVVALVCIAVCALVQPALAEPAEPAVSSDPVAQLPPPPHAKSKLKTSCTTEKPMGSHIKHKKCRSKDEMDQNRAESQAFLDEIRRRSGNSRGTE